MLRMQSTRLQSTVKLLQYLSSSKSQLVVTGKFSSRNKVSMMQSNIHLMKQQAYQLRRPTHLQNSSVLQLLLNLLVLSTAQQSQQFGMAKLISLTKLVTRQTMESSLRRLLLSSDYYSLISKIPGRNLRDFVS